MPDQDKQDKTEEPTALRLEKAREEGNVAKSQEVSSVLLMLVTMLVIMYSGEWIYSEFQSLFRQVFLNLDQPLNDSEQVLKALKSILALSMKVVSPLFLGLLVVSVLANVIQTGVVIAPKAIEPKPEKINPAKGFKKVFSMRSIAELVKGLSKISIIGTIILVTLANETELFITMLVMPMSVTLAEAGNLILLLMTRILTALVILAIVDAMYTRFQHRKELRMTKQEIKDEHKQTEGDPHLKSKRRQTAINLSLHKRLDHAVMSSDVVITNPTHYAVALQYNPDNNQAPLVKARGMRKRALKIRSYANEFDVPIIENPPVARALYASAKEGEQIPAEYFQVVAEILAYVYRLKEKKIN